MTEVSQIENRRVGEIYKVEPPEVTANPDGEVRTLLVACDDAEGERVRLGEVVAKPFLDEGKIITQLAFSRLVDPYSIKTTSVEGIAGDESIYSTVISPFVPRRSSRRRSPQQLAEASLLGQQEAAKVVLAHFGLDFNPENSEEKK
jgi:hypothetical protein